MSQCLYWNYWVYAWCSLPRQIQDMISRLVPDPNGPRLGVMCPLSMRKPLKHVCPFPSLLSTRALKKPLSIHPLLNSSHQSSTPVLQLSNTSTELRDQIWFKFNTVYQTHRSALISVKPPSHCPLSQSPWVCLKHRPWGTGLKYCSSNLHNNRTWPECDQIISITHILKDQP